MKTKVSALYCSPVPQIANGFAVSATNVSFMGRARYSCYEGFKFPSGRESEGESLNSQDLNIKKEYI